MSAKILSSVCEAFEVVKSKAQSLVVFTGLVDYFFPKGLSVPTVSKSFTACWNLAIAKLPPNIIQKWQLVKYDNVGDLKLFLNNTCKTLRDNNINPLTKKMLDPKDCNPEDARKLFLFGWFITCVFNPWTYEMVSRRKTAKTCMQILFEKCGENTFCFTMEHEADIAKQSGLSVYTAMIFLNVFLRGQKGAIGQSAVLMVTNLFLLADVMSFAPEDVEKDIKIYSTSLDTIIKGSKTDDEKIVAKWDGSQTIRESVAIKDMVTALQKHLEKLFPQSTNQNVEKINRLLLSLQDFEEVQLFKEIDIILTACRKIAENHPMVASRLHYYMARMATVQRDAIMAGKATDLKRELDLKNAEELRIKEEARKLKERQKQRVANDEEF